jgi:hypothetical protein
METNKREGENYIKEKHQEDAAFQSPAEKKKNQQEDITQNRHDITPDPKPATNTTRGSGNQMEGQAEKSVVDPEDLNP